MILTIISLMLLNNNTSNSIVAMPIIISIIIIVAPQRSDRRRHRPDAGGCVHRGCGLDTTMAHRRALGVPREPVRVLVPRVRRLSTSEYELLGIRS